MFLSWFFYCRETDICPSMQANLPKLAGTLESLILSEVPINHLCINTLAYLLKFSLSQLALTSCTISSSDYEHLTNAIIKSDLKHLNLSGVEIDHVMGNSLAQLLTQTTTLEVVEVIECDMNCSVVRLLVEVMTHSSVKKLIVHVDKSCKEAMASIPYPRDRIFFY